MSIGSAWQFRQLASPDIGSTVSTVATTLLPFGGWPSVVASTAVEDRVPDLAAARRHDVPVVHRSELLAHQGDRGEAIARLVDVASRSQTRATRARALELLEQIDPRRR